MFQKINLTLLDVDLKRLLGSAYATDGSVYTEYSIPDIGYVRELLKEKVKFDIMPIEAHVLAVTGYVLPHLDTTPTGLNFYLETNSEETFFYKWKDEASIDNTILLAFPIEKLEKVGSFVAKTGDFYLLNTHVPHNVDVGVGKSRLVMRLLFNESFEKVLAGIHLL